MNALNHQIRALMNGAVREAKAKAKMRSVRLIYQKRNLLLMRQIRNFPYFRYNPLIRGRRNHNKPDIRIFFQCLPYALRTNPSADSEFLFYLRIQIHRP